MKDNTQTTALRIRGLSKKFHNRNRTIHALKNLHLDIKKGCCVGIIGHNGSGKSTLLRILAGLTPPSSGYAEINGRIASITDIGIGFHPDLSGWDNLHFAAQLMGLSKKELQPRIPAIVAFSGIEAAMDRPVKQYSNGMFLRLAFAIATEIEADILLFDEVLAVGDAAFQKKCSKRLLSLKEAGKTLLMVSHDLHQILQFADKYMVLDKGHIRSFNNNLHSISTYVAHAQQQELPHEKEQQTQRLTTLKTQLGINIKDITCTNTAPNAHTQHLHLAIALQFMRTQNNPQLVFHIHNFAGHTISTFSSIGHLRSNTVYAGSCLTYACLSPGTQLNPGNYGLSLYIIGNNEEIRFHIPYVHHFHVGELPNANKKNLFHGPFRLHSYWKTTHSITTQQTLYV